MEEHLAATYLLDSTDPSRLTWKEVQGRWGSCLNFFLSYGLRPWDANDAREALAISRACKRGQQEDDMVAEMAAMELIQEEEEAVKKKQAKDKKVKNKSAFVLSELDIQFADQVYNYIKTRKIKSISYNDVIANVPYKGNARGIDVIRNDSRFIESFTKISLRVTATNETVNRTTPVTTPNPNSNPASAKQGSTGGSNNAAPAKQVVKGGSNNAVNSDTAFANKVFAFLKSKKIKSINYNQIIARIPYNGARRGIDVIREDPRFTESTSNVSLSKTSKKQKKVRDFTREWENALLNWRLYGIEQLFVFVGILESCDLKGPPSRKPKFILNENDDNIRDDVSVSSVSSMSALSVASSTGSTLSLRTQDSSDASAASNPFFHLVNDSDSDSDDEENKPEAAVGAATIAKDVAPTQCRYLIVRLKCVIAEVYRNLGIKAQKEQQLSVCSKHWVDAYEMLSTCFGDVEIWSFLLVNIPDAMPEQHNKVEMQKICHSFSVLAEDTDREKKKALEFLESKRKIIMAKLDPMLAERDLVKKSWGSKWTQNPHPKMNYAEKRKLWEQQLRDVNSAISIIAPLRITSSRTKAPSEARE